MISIYLVSDNTSFLLLKRNISIEFKGIFLFFSVLAWAILPLDFRIDFGIYDFRSWRLLTVINASFFLIAAGLLSFGPESPKYLVSQGKMDEALKVLQGIYAGNKKKSPEDFPVIYYLVLSVCLLPAAPKLFYVDVLP